MILNKIFTTEVAKVIRYPGDLTIYKWYANGSCNVYINKGNGLAFVVIRDKNMQLFAYVDEARLRRVPYREVDEDFCVEEIFYMYMKQVYQWRNGEDYVKIEREQKRKQNKERR